MSHDALADLLQRADDAAPPPPAPQRLAARARARARTRRRRQRLAAVLAVPLGLVGASTLLLRAPQGGEVVPVAERPSESRSGSMAQTDQPALLADAARKRAEAALRLAVADGLRAREERRRQAARAAERLVAAEGLPSIAAEREKAALTLLDHGDRLRRDLKQVDAAVAAYRRTIELFPDTRWAAVAKQRIDQLNPDARGENTDHSIT